MKRILNISVWVLLIAGLIVTLGFVNQEENNLKCQKLEIRVDNSNDNYFIEEEDIKAIINNTGNPVVGQPMGFINIPNLEMLINNNPSIAKAEVYKTIDGVLKVEVKQRNPIIRIFTKRNDSFYIDKEGYFMPLSQKYTSRVLIANGYIFSGYNELNNSNISEIIKNDSLAAKTIIDDLFVLAQFINKNEWWTAQIQQIYVDENGELELIPRVGDHRIILGDVNDLEEKFNKLMIFYRQGLSKTGWNEYKTINLKFENQVVCTKI